MKSFGVRIEETRPDSTRDQHQRPTPNCSHMPISTPIPLRFYSQSEFGQVAYEVLHHAFEVHGLMGRNFDETIYRSTLKRILEGRAIEEMEICLTHRGFRKELYFDLVVDQGCPFELKAVSSLSDAHQSQLIQYLMLTGLSHGKLSTSEPNALDIAL